MIHTSSNATRFSVQAITCIRQQEHERTSDYSSLLAVISHSLHCNPVDPTPLCAEANKSHARHDIIMDDSLKAPAPGPNEGATGFNKHPKEGDNLLLLSRQPHPYHQQTHELFEPVFARRSSERNHQDITNDHLSPAPAYSKDSNPVNESGTEADDETYVKRLPSSKTKLHKGLRGRNEVPSGPGTPLLTPAMDGGAFDGIAFQEKVRLREEYKRHILTSRKRNRELGRRGAEVAILGSLAWLVFRKSTAAPTAAVWKNGESCFSPSSTLGYRLTSHQSYRLKLLYLQCCCLYIPCGSQFGPTRNAALSRQACHSRYLRRLIRRRFCIRRCSRLLWHFSLHQTSRM